MDIKDKIVVITGATGGIGKQLCRDFAKNGARLFMIARTREKLEELSNELEGEGHKNYAADFTKSDEVLKVCDYIKNNYSNIDILINAAGVGVYKSVEEVEIQEWSDSMAINATAPFFMVKELIELLKKSQTGVVINIGSGMGKIPTACRSVYCATKYALRGMTLSLAAEFKRTNVKFVHIDLGSTLTEFGPLTLNEKMKENIDGKAYLTPEWVAKKFVEIVNNNQFEEEITLYPSDYSDKAGQ